MSVGDHGEATLELPVVEPLDLVATVRPLSSGFGDPTWRVGASGWRHALRNAAGPATLEVRRAGAGRLRLRAFGPGAEVALEAVPEMLGLDRPPPPADGLSTAVRDLARAARGLRLSRAPSWIAPLTLLVLQQKVSGKEAARAHRELVRAVSQPAPGPPEVADGLWLPPSAEALRALPDWAWAPLGIPARQAATLRRVGLHARRIEALRDVAPEEAALRLRSIPGLGPWTVGSLLLVAGGAADAVPVGDYHLPTAVAFALAGETRADDARMLALLEPHRGHRGWVVRWVEAAGGAPPRRHPRRPLRPLPPGRGAALSSLRRR
ncbi:MAG TPA: DNA-3-methyladenine glycosylase 2 family protein [Myxococcota bacterium]|nr:DNA-3-methyladenine glycosylase 2 family protein [Myxococcota bacterium]